jgi:hypothetical protein
MRNLFLDIIVIELYSARGCPLEEASEHCYLIFLLSKILACDFFFFPILRFTNLVIINENKIENGNVHCITYFFGFIWLNQWNIFIFRVIVA